MLSIEADTRHKLKFSAAVQAAVQGAQPGLSVAGVAALVTAGCLDPHPLSVGMLYKVCEGAKGLHAHKLAPLVLATKSAEPLRVVAEAAGYLIVPMPLGSRLEGHALRNAVRENAEGVEAVCAALDASGSGGRRITWAEFEGIERELNQSIAATASLREECRALAMGVGEKRAVEERI